MNRLITYFRLHNYEMMLSMTKNKLFRKMENSEALRTVFSGTPEVSSKKLLHVMRCAIWYQSPFGVCMIIQTHANACSRFFLPPCRFYPFE